MSLENYFQDFRENIIGRDQTFVGPFGEKKIIYADWVASGRLYKANLHFILYIILNILNVKLIFAKTFFKK